MQQIVWSERDVSWLLNLPGMPLDGFRICFSTIYTIYLIKLGLQFLLHPHPGKLSCEDGCIFAIFLIIVLDQVKFPFWLLCFFFLLLFFWIFVTNFILVFIWLPCRQFNFLSLDPVFLSYHTHSHLFLFLLPALVFLILFNSFGLFILSVPELFQSGNVCLHFLILCSFLISVSL